MMRCLLILPWLTAAACAGGGDCIDGTLALLLTPAVPTADTLRVRTTVSGAMISTDTGYTGQREVSATFPGVAYEAGLHVDVLVEARKGNAVVASASATDYVLPKTCGVLPLTLSTANTAFPIGGTVTGLDGTGLVLANDGDRVRLTARHRGRERERPALGDRQRLTLVRKDEPRAVETGHRAPDRKRGVRRRQREG